MSLQPTRTRLSTETRQAEIVDAVLDLSGTLGPGAITTVDIAKNLGLTQGAVFKHFPTKDAIWLAVMGWVESHLLSALDEAAAAASTPLEGLRAVFMKHARFVARHPGVPRLLFNELQKPQDTPVKRRARSMQESYRKLLVRLLAEAEKRGEVAVGLDREGAATLFLGALQGLMLQAMLAGSTAKLEAEAKRVFALYLNAIRETS
ncbi:MAG: TetR/AcrR family transcriptional regulator [Rhodocyclaceae bacterium]|jgi:AcrR family transcriptional regulator|nr:TetR/AcrR family transcriptional regulator [Rhodocyclaceae bacterium]MCZ7653635.1 TetR/AcrR family transcriptional regulator [Rhodocyclaceae bacterium]